MNRYGRSVEKKEVAAALLEYYKSEVLKEEPKGEEEKAETRHYHDVDAYTPEKETAPDKKQRGVVTDEDGRIIYRYDAAEAQLALEEDLLDTYKQNLKEREDHKNSKETKEDNATSKKYPDVEAPDTALNVSKTEYEGVDKSSRFYRAETRDIEAVESYEKDVEDGALIDFAEDYKLKYKRAQSAIRKEKKSGKFGIEYGSAFDPVYDGSFNHYGLPKTDDNSEPKLITLGTGKRRTARREQLSYMDKNKISKLTDSQIDTDIKMIEARLNYQSTVLELDIAKSELRYSTDYENNEEKRWRRRSKRKVKDLRRKIRAAAEFEKLDNKRYYSVVNTNFDTVELPRKADREGLVAMREELMRLLDIRDEINTELYDLYTGTEDNMRGSLKGRTRAELYARKKTYKKYRALCNTLWRMRVTRNEKLRLYDMIDEYIAVNGELAKIKYILNKEKPQGKARREYLKDRSTARSDARELKKAIEHSSIRSLKKAKRRMLQNRAMFISYTILILLIAGVGIAVVYREALMAFIMDFINNLPIT